MRNVVDVVRKKIKLLIFCDSLYPWYTHCRKYAAKVVGQPKLSCMLARVFAYGAKIVSGIYGGRPWGLGALWVTLLEWGDSLLYVSSQLNYGCGVPDGVGRHSCFGVGWPQTGSTMVGASKGLGTPYR